MFRILFLSIGLLFAGELEVDGVIKANSGIDANNNPITNVGIPQSMSDAINGNVLQGALRDEGNYEYKTVVLRIYPENLYNDSTPEDYRRYKDLESTNYTNSNFDDYITSLSSQGYQLYQISPPIWYGGIFCMFLYTFKRPIQE